MGPLGKSRFLRTSSPLLLLLILGSNKPPTQVSLENGLVLNFDARTLPSNLSTPSPARYTLSAHDGAVSALDISPHIRGCVATGGTDKMVKVWNVADGDGGKPSVSMVASRDLGVVSCCFSFFL